MQTYDLGDGCQMTVELRDQAEGVQAGAAMPLAVTGEWKPYGNRYFTAKATKIQAARTPGASDVNMYCTFTCKVSSITSKYKLNTTVQYLAHDTIGKRIKIGLTWKLTKLS